MTRTSLVNDMEKKFDKAGFLTCTEIKRYLGIKGKNNKIDWLLDNLTPVKIGKLNKYSTLDIAEKIMES